MKKLLFLAVIAALIVGYIQEQGVSLPGLPVSTQSADRTLQNAYNNRQSDLRVQGEGVVTKILRDDLDGSRHQRFILKIASGQTFLVAHNIDLAPRINGLRTGDTIEFYGEYEWNSKGGVIHWTHHDPAGRHIGGWLKHGGKTYQ
ncbi:MAG: DUF3465 domain-containing protein [Thiogranum sp.]